MTYNIKRAACVPINVHHNKGSWMENGKAGRKRNFEKNTAKKNEDVFDDEELERFRE